MLFVWQSPGLLSSLWLKLSEVPVTFKVTLAEMSCSEWRTCHSPHLQKPATAADSRCFDWCRVCHGLSHLLQTNMILWWCLKFIKFKRWQSTILGNMESLNDSFTYNSFLTLLICLSLCILFSRWGKHWFSCGGHTGWQGCASLSLTRAEAQSSVNVDLNPFVHVKVHNVEFSVSIIIQIHTAAPLHAASLHLTWKETKLRQLNTNDEQQIKRAADTAAGATCNIWLNKWKKNCNFSRLKKITRSRQHRGINNINSTAAAASNTHENKDSFTLWSRYMHTTVCC